MHTGAHKNTLVEERSSSQLGIATYFGVVALMMLSVLANNTAKHAQMSDHGVQQNTLPLVALHHAGS